MVCICWLHCLMRTISICIFSVLYTIVQWRITVQSCKMLWQNSLPQCGLVNRPLWKTSLSSNLGLFILLILFDFRILLQVPSLVWGDLQFSKNEKEKKSIDSWIFIHLSLHMQILAIRSRPKRPSILSTIRQWPYCYQSSQFNYINDIYIHIIYYIYKALGFRNVDNSKW